MGYPAYKSFKAIESKSKEDDTQWLTYWVVYGVFNILEHAVAFVVAMIPYYGLFKMGFLIFCYHPSTMGATQIYSKVLSPYVVPCHRPGEGRMRGAFQAPCVVQHDAQIPC